MAIVINGSGTVTGISVGGLPDGIVDAGTLATNSVDSAELIDGSIDTAHIATDQITSAILPAGSVLQVVQITSNTSTNPNTSFADLGGADITITPSATSSKILVMWNTGGMISGANYEVSCRILRDATVIRDMDRYGYDGESGTVWQPCPIFLQYLDSPSTTSAINYSLQFKVEADEDFRINSNADTAGLVGIAMEIGA